MRSLVGTSAARKAQRRYLWGAIIVLALLAVLPACTGRNLFTTNVWAAPLAVNDTIVLGTQAGQVVAIDPISGAELWSISTETGRGGASAIYGSPVTDGETVYVGGFDGILYAIGLQRSDADRVLWTCTADSAFVGGAVIAGDLIIAGSEDGTLYALNRTAGPGPDGTCQTAGGWTFKTNGNIWAAPAVSDDTVYVGTLDGTLHAVRLTDGAPAWPRPFQAEAGIATTPLVADGIVYIGSFDDRFYALDAATGQPRWPQPFQAENWFWAEPLLHQGLLYAPSLDHNIYVLDAATGTLRREPIATGLDGFLYGQGAIRSAPALVGADYVLVVNEAGETWWLNIKTSGVQPGTKVPAAVYAPVMSVDGVAYIYAQDGALYRVTPTARQPVKVYPLSE